MEKTKDFVLEPSKITPKIDTSKWPLLLKVRVSGKDDRTMIQ